MQFVMAFVIDLPLSLSLFLSAVHTDFNARLCTCENTSDITGCSATQTHSPIHTHSRWHPFTKYPLKYKSMNYKSY